MVRAARAGRGATRVGHRGHHPAVAGQERRRARRGAAEALLADVGRFAALAVGPGLGGVGDPDLQFVVRTLVAEARKPLVLDADGLNALAGDLAQLRARQTLGGPIVLTPHAGEYQRLMGAPVGANRLVAAQALAERAGAVVLLKGPGTVVASPDGAVALNPTGGAALATAGSGDVLTGIIAGFLARGVDAFRAAAAAAGCTVTPPTGWSRPTVPGWSQAISSPGWAVRCRSWE